MSKSTIIIVGGTGSIGSAIAKSLDNDYKPFLIARNKDRLEKLASKLKCQYAISDIKDEDSYRNIFIHKYYVDE